MLLAVLFLSPSLVYASVLLSGGPYCTDSGLTNTVHAVPDHTTISITCAVDNIDGTLNVLAWIIPPSVSVANVDGANNTLSDFISIVNSANNTDATTNATLSFTAVSELDGAVVNCRDGASVTESCTLYILSKLYH